MSANAPDWRTPTIVLVASAVILSIGMGIRHGFGLFLSPVSVEMGWGRETFALAIAVQNLTWGITQPFTGMLADRFGSAKILIAGCLLYALGLVTMSFSTSPWLFVLTAGVLIGTGQSGVTYSVVSGVLGRKVSRAGAPIDVTSKEFQLLEFLARRAGQVVTRTMLLEAVWDLHFDPQTNVIDVHISRLRAAIDKGFDRPLLHTVRGAGYVLRDGG